MSYSYWVKLYRDEELLFDGLVFGHEEIVNQDTRRLSVSQGDRENLGFLQTVSSHRGQKLRIEYQPAWEDVTNKYRLPSKSLA